MPDHEQIVTRKPSNAMRLMLADPRHFKRTKYTLVNVKAHLDVWNAIVEEYSGRELTIPSDELPAIGGVAQLMQKNFGGEYDAGIWREHIPQDSAGAPEVFQMISTPLLRTMKRRSHLGKSILHPRGLRHQYVTEG